MSFTENLRQRALALFAAGGICLASCAGPLPDESAWPGWRGPGGLGISPESDLPEVWSSESANIRWRADIPGQGNSSPIVSRQRVFLTTSYGKPDDRSQKAEKRRRLKFVVLALDLETGSMLWQTPVHHGFRGKKHHLNTYAAPTPVADGETVFAYFGQWLAALDYDGEIRWRVETDPDFHAGSRYGAAASPILVGRSVVVFQDNEGDGDPRPSWIAAFDKRDGRQLWRREWRGTCCSYVTPIVVRRDGAAQIVTATSKLMMAYDAESGDELWRADHRVLQPVPSPVTAGDLLCVPGGIHDKELAMYRLGGTGADTRAEPVWKSRSRVPEIASPVLYRGLLFTLTDGGIMTCLDAETGERYWRKRLRPALYRPSLVAGDGKVYATSTQGITSVIAAEREFRILAVNELGEGSDASPAIADGHLLIRGPNSLTCIGKEAPPPA